MTTNVLLILPFHFIQLYEHYWDVLVLENEFDFFVLFFPHALTFVLNVSKLALGQVALDMT